MSDTVISSGLFPSHERFREAVPADERTELRVVRSAQRWEPRSFARQQLRGLVRQIFFSQSAPGVRHVVFAPAGEDTDFTSLCRNVGELLSCENPGSIAVSGNYPGNISITGRSPQEEAAPASSGLRKSAQRMKANLWMVPLQEGYTAAGSTAWLQSHLCSLRREFDYSIVEIGTPNEVIGAGQLVDGIILVISAHRTRRAPAMRFKERLDAAQVRILGTVLIDRTFPIPEEIYRRL